MTQAIIYARVTSQHSNLDTKIDNLVNYCSSHKLSIIKKYSICAKYKDTCYLKHLYEDVKALPNKHINIVAYLNGQKLIYKLQKPFDKLVNLKNASTWFDFDKSDIKEYETMAEKVQMYKVERERWIFVPN